MQSKSIVFTYVAALSAVFAQPVLAQTYPAKSIRVIIAQAPGSTTDVVARVVGNKMAEGLGQQLVVDARPGAGGTLGTELAARAPADGYTLFMANNSTHGSNPALYAKLSYDAVKDFTPIIYVVSTPYVLSVHPSLPAKNLKELIALAKARPGQINYASAGNGSTHHLSGELLKSMAGIDIVHIPYKGTTPAISALISGEVSIMFATVTGIQPQIKAGRTRGIAVTTPKRSAMLPELPTMGETLAGFEMLSWFGLLAPAGTPPAIINSLQAEMKKIVFATENLKMMDAQGIVPVVSTPEDFRKRIATEAVRWKKFIEEKGIKAEE